MQAWFETIRYMRANKSDVVSIMMPVMGVDQDLAERTYDHVMPMFTLSGEFQPKGLDVIARSFVETGTLPTKPDLANYYTEKFLPSENASK